MKKFFLNLFSLSFFMSINLHAQSDWFGKWQTDQMVEGTEKAIIEYYFKNDSVMSMSFVTDNQIAGVGRCVSNVSMDGKYDKIGPLFFVSLNQRSLKVSLLKFVTYGKNTSVSEGQIIKQIENTVKPMFANFEDVRMIYVTHDSPDTISFILGDESNAIDLEFHRSTMTIEQLFDLDEETDVNDLDNSFETYDSEVNDITSVTKYKDTKESSPMVKMWKSLGFFMLYLVLSLAAIFGLKVLFAKNMSRTNTAKKSVNIRIGYSVVRFVLRIVIIIIGIILWAILLVHGNQVSNYMTILILCSGGGLLLNLLSSLSLPMNFMTMKKFMSKERNFILYLRGFITDNYTPSMVKIADTVSNAKPWNTNFDSYEKEINPNQLTLNEKSLAKAWKRYYQTYSVGLPEELESPEGTKRIYLDNDSWMSDARTLMELAKYILVSVHPNDNCIWEIRQCNTVFSDKTIYYVDDIINLNIVKEKMGEELPTCLKSEEIVHNHMMVYLKGGQTIVKAYSNTEIGLKNAVYGFLISDKS